MLFHTKKQIRKMSSEELLKIRNVFIDDNNRTKCVMYEHQHDLLINVHRELVNRNIIPSDWIPRNHYCFISERPQGHLENFDDGTGRQVIFWRNK